MSAALKIILTVSIFLFPFIAYSQPVASDNCASAPLINTLGTYTGNTGNFTPNDALWFKNSNNFCSSVAKQTVENNGFYKFIASSTSISYTVCAPTGCVNHNSFFGISGIQFLIFEMPSGICGVGSITKKHCIPQLSGTDCGSCGNPKGCLSFTTGGFSIGTTYYVMIDGYEGDICPYSIQFTTGIVLPVELISFYGTPADNGNKLQWTTATEINNNHFDVECTPDGKNFKTIGTLKGMGNSSVPVTYNFLDERPADFITYYRLKQTDHNGEVHYSHIMNVKNNVVQHAQLTPNPAIDELTVETIVQSNGLYLFSIEGITGNCWQEEFYLTKGMNQVKVNLTDKLSAGFYIFKVYSLSGHVLSIDKFIKAGN